MFRVRFLGLFQPGEIFRIACVLFLKNFGYLNPIQMVLRIFWRFEFMFLSFFNLLRSLKGSNQRIRS
jgi:hypothetical protein